MLSAGVRVAGSLALVRSSKTAQVCRPSLGHAGRARKDGPLALSSALFSGFSRFQNLDLQRGSTPQHGSTSIWSTDRRRSGARIDALQAMSGSRKPPRVNVPAPVVVAATDEEAANLQVFHVLSGGAPPEGSGINEVFNATNEMYAHAMARLGREPNIRPLQRSKSEGSPLLSRSVPRRPGKKRCKAEPVEDAPPSSSADLSHLRAIGASESTWHESVRRSAMESWRELQRDASCHTPFPSSTSCRFPPISRSRLTVQSEPSIRMAVFSLGRGSPSTRHATYSRPTPSRTRGELHWSPDGR